MWHVVLKKLEQRKAISQELSPEKAKSSYQRFIE